MMTRIAVDLLVSYAMQFAGLPYRWGGDDPMDGFDCSGLVQELLASVGADFPGDQTAQALHDRGVAAGWKPCDAATAGSVVFFGASVGKITHVGFGIGQHLMLEAGGGGSATTSRDAATRQNAYIRVRPIANRKDCVAILDPFALTRTS